MIDHVGRAARTPENEANSRSMKRSEMPDLPSGTVTFLFTDVEGSTKLLHELGAEGYAAALAEHRRVVRDACAHHHGVEWTPRGMRSSVRAD